jgi:hypothetical protein
MEIEKISNIGVMSDFPGSGKSFPILQLVCHQEFPTITIDPVVENKSIFSVVISKFNNLITYLQEFITPLKKHT